MPLHRLGVDQRDARRLAAQHGGQMVHRALADAHVVIVVRDHVDVDDTLLDHVHHLSRRHLRRGTMGPHMHVGNPVEHRIALPVQAHPTLVRVAAVEHRAAAAAVGAFHGLLRVGLQIDHTPPVRDVRRQRVLRGGGHRGTAAEREDAAETVDRAADQIALDLAERGFAVPREIVGDAHADLALDLQIGVPERQSHHLRDLAADPGLAGAHHADDHGNGMSAHLMCSGQEAR